MAISDSNKTYNDDQSATADIVNIAGVEGVLTVGTTAVEVKVGASPLTGRKVVTLYNNSNQTIYWGFNNTVTTSTGSPIEKTEFIVWDVGDSLSIWVIAGTADNNTRITEAS